MNYKTGILWCTTLCLLVCLGCTKNVKVVERVASPNGRVDVVVCEINNGATVGYITEVYIVPSGESNVLQAEYLRLRADHVKSLAVKWLDNHTLIIEYDGARIFSYCNFWESKNVDNYKYKISIIEKIRI